VGTFVLISTDKAARVAQGLSVPTLRNVTVRVKKAT
jgi:hypothetical protein